MKKFVFLFLLISSSANASILDCDQVRDDEKLCLACNLYHEARGEDYYAQVDVAAVVILSFK